MFTLIALAICAAVTLASAICQSLRDHVTVNQVGYVLPKEGGFSKFISTSSSQKMTVAMKKGSSLCSSYAKKITKFLPSSQQDSMGTKIAEFLDVMADIGGYEIEGANTFTHSVTFNKDTKEFHFFTIIFTPISAEKMTVQTIDCKAQIELPYSFAILETTTANKWRTKTQQSLQEIPTALDSQAVVDAISMALAPALSGSVSVPKEFLESIKLQAQTDLADGAKVQSSFK